MKKHNPTSHISEILNKTTFGEMMKGNKMGSVIKHSTIFSFWNNIVGAKFSRITKPYAIKYNKLYVSAKSPVVVQELILYKAKIIRNINSYSLPLGIEIKDIVFSYKIFAVSNPITDGQIEDKPIEITQMQIENLKIDNDIKQAIENNVDKIKFLNEEQKARFANKIISTYKVKNLQEEKQ